MGRALTWRPVGRFLGVFALISALFAGLAGAATAPKSLSYKVRSATVSARLTYSGVSTDATQRTSGTAQLTARRATGLHARSKGSLTAAGGRISVLLRLKQTERATLGERAGPSDPYVERQCADTRARNATGGVLLKRLAGGRVEVRWAFPHAVAMICPGPVNVGKRLEKRMARIYPASRFAVKHPTITLSGTTPFEQSVFSGTYRWRATLVLTRR